MPGEAAHRQFHTGRWILLVFFGIFVLLYFLIAFSLRDTFLPGTWINEIYCTGLTVEEANELLHVNILKPSVSITCGEEEYTFQFPEGSYSYDYTGNLKAYMKVANSLHWPMAIVRQEVVSVAPVFTLDRDNLIRQWEELKFVRDDRAMDRSLHLVYDPKEGFSLYNGLIPRLKEEEALSDFLEAASSGSVHFQVDDSYYEEMRVTPADMETMALFDRIQAFQTFDLVYDMGAEKLTFSPADMAGFLKLDRGMPVMEEDGSFALNEDLVSERVEEMLNPYNTYGRDRKFRTTKGDTVVVRGGTYGTTVDIAAEQAYVIKALKDPSFFDGVEDTHIPKYKREGYVRGLDDIGDTYIEVDLTSQKAYAYKDGELLLETDIVSGNRGITPEGTDYIYFKQRNRTLIGPDYRTFVNYWMAVIDHIGLHDATWRKSFGGDIYMGNGSHGCVNLPKSVASTLYDTYEVGTPVIMYKRKSAK